MKNIILVLGVIFLFMGCNNHNNINLESNTIIGTWQLEATVFSDGAKEIVNPIVEGQVIVFKNDNSFEITNSNINCASGVYSIIKRSQQYFNADVILLNCENQSSFAYSYFIENKKLFLTLLLEDGTSGCDEICAERYQKK